MSPENSQGAVGSSEGVGSGVVALQSLKVGSMTRAHEARGLSGQGISKNSPAGSRGASVAHSQLPQSQHQITDASIKAVHSNDGSLTGSSYEQALQGHVHSEGSLQEKGGNSLSGKKVSFMSRVFQPLQGKSGYSAQNQSKTDGRIGGVPVDSAVGLSSRPSARHNSPDQAVSDGENLGKRRW